MSSSIFHRRAAELKRESSPPIQKTQEKINPFRQRAEELQQSKKPEPEQPPDFFEEGFGLEFEKDVERHQARGMSRFLESALGMPGDLASLASGLFGMEQKILPTSEKIRQFSEKATKGYTSPRNELEKFGDEIMSDIGGMLFPGARKYNVARNIGIPMVGNLIKQGLKYSGVEDKNAAYSKMGSMVVLDLLSNRSGMGGGVRKYASNLFRDAENLIPETAVVDASGLQKSLSNLQKSLEKGGKRPSTQKALEKVNEIQGEIKNGQIGMKELMAYRPSINELISEYGGFEVQLPKAVRQKAIRNLQNVKRATIDAAEEWGTKNSPEFLKLNRSANEAWSAYENSDKISKFIQKTVGDSLKSNQAKGLLGLGSVGGTIATGIMAPGILKAATGVGAVGVPLYETFKVLNRVKNSKTLAKYYGNILKGAAVGNASQVIRNAKDLDKELQKGSVSSK